MGLKESRYGCDFATNTERWLITKLGISSLKQLMFDQTEQNGYQTVPFGNTLII